VQLLLYLVAQSWKTFPAQSPYQKIVNRSNVSSRRQWSTHAECQVKDQAVCIEVTGVLAVTQWKICIRSSPVTGGNIGTAITITNGIGHRRIVPCPEPHGDTTPGGFLHGIPTALIIIERRSVRVGFCERRPTPLVEVDASIAICGNGLPWFR
jgi:hypothetical protein